MSGHSKWSQIKRQKGAADVKRGASFSKLSNAIIVAAKSGGDINTNFTLKMAVEKAKVANMPKDTIDRAIKRGTGEIAGVAIEETLYEIIAPGNIGIIVEAATDNKNRTTAELKNVLTKFGAKLGSHGSVTYQFSQMGKLIVEVGANPPAGGKEELELMLIDAGAEDFIEHDQDIAVYTNPHDLELTKKSLENQGINILEVGLSWEPQDIVEIEDSERANKIISFTQTLESLEDVTAIYVNFDLI